MVMAAAAAAGPGRGPGSAVRLAVAVAVGPVLGAGLVLVLGAATIGWAAMRAALGRAGQLLGERGGRWTAVHRTGTGGRRAGGDCRAAWPG